jgi:anti-anti-sigma factor
MSSMTTQSAVAQGPAASGSRRVQTIVLPRRFDVHTLAQFELEINRIAAAGPVVVIDASEVRYMDRRAMDSLIEARLRCMDRGGDLILAAASVAARVILELSGRYESLNPVEAAAEGMRAPIMVDAA